MMAMAMMITHRSDLGRTPIRSRCGTAPRKTRRSRSLSGSGRLPWERGYYHYCYWYIYYHVGCCCCWAGGARRPTSLDWSCMSSPSRGVVTSSRCRCSAAGGGRSGPRLWSRAGRWGPGSSWALRLQRRCRVPGCWGSKTVS